MTYSDALNYYNASQARDDIISGPGDLVSKSRQLANFDRLASKPAPQARQWTFKDVVHGAIGAGLGAGVARGVSRALGVSPRFADKLETAAMGVGAAMNTGVIKWASADDLNKRASAVMQQRRDAFRLGFLKAAHRLGAFKKEALIPVVTLNPADLLKLPGAAAQSVTGGSRMLGTAVGTADAPDESEEELTKLEAERILLEERLERLREDRRNRAIRDVLAKQPT